MATRRSRYSATQGPGDMGSMDGDGSCDVVVERRRGVSREEAGTG